MVNHMLSEANAGMHLQHHWQSYTIIKLIRAALNVLLYCVIILNEYLSERFVFYLILLFDSYVWKVTFSYLAVFSLIMLF